jgi:hypothetical protein
VALALQVPAEQMVEVVTPVMSMAGRRRALAA